MAPAGKRKPSWRSPVLPSGAVGCPAPRLDREGSLQAVFARRGETLQTFGDAADEPERFTVRISGL